VNEFDFVSVECEVSYRGNWAPVISCEPIGQVVTNNLTDSYRRYQQVIFASRQIHDEVIVCTTTFTTAPNFKSSSPTNFTEHPNKPYIWKSPTIRVISRPKSGNYTFSVFFLRSSCITIHIPFTEITIDLYCMGDRLVTTRTNGRCMFQCFNYVSPTRESCNYCLHLTSQLNLGMF